ncbi:hypothetical protein BKA82DRAFT_1008518 [Pisolithus tinctorius]|uniref:Uncharacterized protein n=1 Tax=Pisolithus tinctorius Marx 270 TaxID=870435 RepID=A0A0C3NEN2_PISTI|nr:hypothetical protein BKA82DRAFT_1008518 [Pisolithus tinctorius]KIN94215.1 hypothetical protein M404DRAFT_1008518 [Pisolithus tinctorius Marx 270]
MQQVEPVLESISQTLSTSLLHHIETTLRDVYFEHEHSRTGQANRNVYESQLNIPSMVQEIRVLQAELEAAEDSDEQRALVEDITGKILWLCWCGIYAEVNRLLPKVVNYIRRERNMTDLEQSFDFKISIRYPDPDDDQAHLQRIMLDAKAGISKHQLLLDARAAEQSKWSGATSSRDTNHTDTQGPHTSPQTPSTSMV